MEKEKIIEFLRNSGMYPKFNTDEDFEQYISVLKESEDLDTLIGWIENDNAPENFPVVLNMLMETK